MKKDNFNTTERIFLILGLIIIFIPSALIFVESVPELRVPLPVQSALLFIGFFITSFTSMRVVARREKERKNLEEKEEIEIFGGVDITSQEKADKIMQMLFKQNKLIIQKTDSLIGIAIAILGIAIAILSIEIISFLS